jgi:hypothetical protein
MSATRKTDRTVERAASPLVGNPIVVAEFWKNRHGESIRATLVAYENRNCFDLRQYFVGHGGRMTPTTKGITIAVLRLPELAKACTKALSKARELGLLATEDV